MKIIEINNVCVKIGENAIENWKLLDASNNNDYLMHLSDYSSGYAIWSSDKPIKKFLKKIKSLLYKYSKIKSCSKIKADYCKVKDVKKGNIIGEIFMKNVKII